MEYSKIHLYLNAKHFDVVVGHKTLKSIFGSNSKLSTNIFRWQLELQKYSFDINYQKGKDHGADFISRILHSKDEKRQDIENPRQFYVNFVTQHVILIIMLLFQIKEASANDSEAQSLLKAIRTRKWYEQSIKHYEKIKFEFTENVGSVLGGNGIFIPAKLKQKGLITAIKVIWELLKRNIVNERKSLLAKVWIKK